MAHSFHSQIESVCFGEDEILPKLSERLSRSTPKVASQILLIVECSASGNIETACCFCKTTTLSSSNIQKIGKTLLSPSFLSSLEFQLNSAMEEDS